jgi:hypothetical protein
MKVRLLPFIALLLIQLACATTNLPTQRPASTSESTQLTPQSSTLPVCEWFLQTQLLRTRRLAGLTEFIEWYQVHAAAGFDAVTVADSAELIAILERYQPYQEDFLEAWIDLGSIPQGQEFWEKELRSVQLRIEAFDNMIIGYGSSDLATINAGIDLFEQSQKVGLEGESAMMQVRSMCTGG